MLVCFVTCFFCFAAQPLLFFFFFFNDTATTEIYTLSLHDALPISETLYGGYYARAGGEWPGEVGPFYIEGATTNDTLAVKILRLHPNRDHAVSTHTPGFISAIASDRYTRMLNPPIPARRYVWRLEKNGTVGVLDLPESKKRLEVPLSPMLGRVAVAPEGEQAWAGLWPGNFGGNMDVSDVAEGATLYLPIFHDGAYFYFGDGHALQGDGELCGSGLETTMEVIFQFDVIKGRKLAWPRIETSEFDDRQRATPVRCPAYCCGGNGRVARGRLQI